MGAFICPHCNEELEEVLVPYRTHTLYRYDCDEDAYYYHDNWDWADEDETPICKQCFNPIPEVKDRLA